MENIDDLFKKPNAPGNKRKLEALDDPGAIYKASKIKTNGDVKTNGHASVQDEADDDVEAGPELPPDDEDVDEEEGRFFGGGISKDTVEILNYVDTQQKDDGTKPEKIDVAWVRKLALNFEKKISKNSELRAKFEDDPPKFMSSEADLDAEIKVLSILSGHPDLYSEFVKLGCVASLVSLLSHENTDIAIDAIEIINELTDEDVEAEQKQWDIIVDAMLESDLLNLLYENISRLDEDSETDRAGVYQVLSVLENLSSRIEIAESEDIRSNFVPWLLKRMQRKESVVSQNKQYSAELLAILLQSSSSNRARVVGLNGIDAFLQLLSPYRKRDPSKGTEEEEYVENVFDSLACSLDSREGKDKFLEAEGIELCLIMLREGKMSKPRALRLLDHALGGHTGASCCQRLVEAAGLKGVFSTFMKKHDNQTVEHILAILSAMFRSLAADSPERIRLLGKFVEKDYGKIDRAMQLRRDIASRVHAIDHEIAAERSRLPIAEQEDRSDAWLFRRLDAGLYSLQTVDIILAWLVAEDAGAASKVEALLAERDESLQDLRATMQEQLDGMDAEQGITDVEFKDMLKALIQQLS